ncbi:MAG TPA: 4Fe-4S dicluster domain-containing protein [Phycisphaerae bacterium]|nr:4Fe-4S dicluster domain-containing protein [Phycisphaerae bacterium]
MSETPKQRSPVTEFHESHGNWLRITTVRIIVQTTMFALFLSFVALTTFAKLDQYPTLRHWVSKILEVDPLVSIATALTTHTIYKGLLWSLLILIPTLFIGRFFCGWICPYGALHHFVGWAFGGLKGKRKADANRYRPMFAFKYYVLLAMLVLTIFGSLQIGLLDPICLVYRSFTGSVLPALNMPVQSIFGDYRLHQGGWFIGALLFFFVAMNLVIPRFFCRVLCPLGALMGFLSRFAWWRIERNCDLCDYCNQCPTSCEGACEPDKELRRSECFVCFNCIEDCPTGALTFAFLPPKDHEVTSPDVRRRSVVVAALAGLALYPFARSSAGSTRNFSAKCIRPPGSTEELEFLSRCIKCGQCIRVCPTNVLQPAWSEAGVEGLWTPVMNFRIGHCQLHCTACGQVCPTGAIQRISVEEKLGLGEFADRGPIKLGTAHFDTGRCLPYSKNIPCVVCEEVCPTSPKAIYTERQMRTIRDGKKTVTASTDSTVTLGDPPLAGQTLAQPTTFPPDRFRGDETTLCYVLIRHPDGMTETQRILGNDARTLRIEGRFARAPETGSTATIKLEYKVPSVDTRLCIGCGLCERECPVVGDRRAVYVTAEGESRSQYYGERDRNRSLRLLKSEG